MRQPHLTLALTAVIAGCCAPAPAPPEAAEALAPTTLEAARALHDPPRTIVEVDKLDSGSSGLGACGHTAACVIVPLAQLLGSAAGHEATVTRGGEVLWEGVFGPDGTLVEGMATVGDRVHVSRRVDLPRLGRVEQLEVAHGRPGPDGALLDMERTMIQPQVDLRGAYAAAVAAAGPDEAGRLLEEAWPILGPEMADLASEHLGPGAADPTRARMASAVCAAPQPDLLELAGEEPGVETAGALAACAAARGEAVDGAALCAGSARWAMRGLEGNRDRAWVEGAQSACAGPGAAVLAVHRDESPPVDALTEALLEEDVRPWLIREQKPSGPAWRRAMFAALERGSPADRAFMITYIHGYLARPARELAPEEVAALAVAYAGGIPEVYDRSFQPATLEMLAAHTGPSGDRARAVLTEALAGAGPGDDAALAAALAAMGDRTHLDTAATALQAGHLAVGRKEATDLSSMVCYALVLGGCPYPGIKRFTEEGGELSCAR